MTSAGAACEVASDRDAFSPGTLRLAGLAARALGWRPAEFWHATPAELATAIAPEGAAPDYMSRADVDRLLKHDEG